MAAHTWFKQGLDLRDLEVRGHPRSVTTVVEARLEKYDVLWAALQDLAEAGDPYGFQQ